MTLTKVSVEQVDEEFLFREAVGYDATYYKNVHFHTPE